jgi:toxin ParE1/3/4
VPSLVVKVHRLADGEIFEAFQYYQAERPGLGEELRAKLRALTSKLARFPMAAPMWEDQPTHRIATLDRFPYRVPYQIQPDQIVVLALAHTRRRPGYWKSRLGRAAPR